MTLAYALSKNVLHIEAGVFIQTVMREVGRTSESKTYAQFMTKSYLQNV